MGGSLALLPLLVCMLCAALRDALNIIEHTCV